MVRAQESRGLKESSQWRSGAHGAADEWPSGLRLHEMGVPALDERATPEKQNVVILRGKYKKVFLGHWLLVLGWIPEIAKRKHVIEKIITFNHVRTQVPTEELRKNEQTSCIRGKVFGTNIN